MTPLSPFPPAPLTPLLALFDRALPIPRASEMDARRVRYMLRLTMPPGLPSDVPDYVAIVKHVTWSWLEPYKQIATVVLFDGATAILTISSQTPYDHPELIWDRHPSEVPFGYDRKLGRWRRYPELMSLAAEHAEAISRLDVAAVAAVRAERHRARALRAAETRRRNRAAAGV